MRVGIPIADLCAGLFCALGILVALLEREKSKKGQHVATSLLQAQIFMLDFQGARWLIDGEVPKQAGNNHPTSIPTGVFKTADGHINIAATGQKIWERFCSTLEAPELIHHPDYKTGAERSKNRDALNDEIGRHTAKRTQRRMGRAVQPRQACRAGRSTRSTRSTVIRRSSISRMAQPVEDQEQDDTAHGGPADDAVAHAEPAGVAAARSWASTPTRC